MYVNAVIKNTDGTVKPENGARLILCDIELATPFSTSCDKKLCGFINNYTVAAEENRKLMHVENVTYTSCFIKAIYKGINQVS